jgi:hypothetical protein
LTGRAKFPALSPEQLASCPDEYFNGLCEGDDGIFEAVDIDQQLIDDLGILLKLDKYPHYGEASFCGNVCHPTDNAIITDPLKVLRNFFVLSGKYAKARKGKHLALLRAKALSYKCLFNDCPIVGELCDWVCLKTKHVQVSGILPEVDQRKREFIQMALDEKLHLKPANVSMKSRLQMEKCFNVTTAEQMRIESEIRKSTDYLVVDLRLYTQYRDLSHSERFCTAELLPPLIEECIDPQLQLILDQGKTRVRPRRIVLRADKELAKCGLPIEFEASLFRQYDVD